jgi:hypothetical protein
MLFVGHDWYTVACRHELVTIVYSCVKRVKPVSVATAHTITAGIKDRKLLLVARNKVDRLRQQTTQLGRFVKAGRWQQQHRS